MYPTITLRAEGFILQTAGPAVGSQLSAPALFSLSQLKGVTWPTSNSVLESLYPMTGQCRI